ncbi:chorismate mutase [Halobacillus locisalis]|uniref:chorismate mutase n=1 Tax=Halobacillus locisalis TaxID=220753 RepID=A0A838CPW4_9BACI|nr:chorismate mutase [Halobacillus locisalis]MBA2173879.1 chorismate mutase [Halobacillus locisalis]
MIRGVRGATTVTRNSADEIIEKSVALMEDIISENEIVAERVASVYFTVTEDLNDTFPAKSLRELDGWTHVPVMCMREIPVPASLPMCIRVMVTVETDKHQEEIEHIYHHEATKLRPDLQKKKGEG